MERNVWYRLGHALESARLPANPPRGGNDRGRRQARERRRNGDRDSTRGGEHHDLESALISTSGSVLTRALDRALGPREPVRGYLVTAVVAGAVAAVLSRSVRPLLRREDESTALDAEALVDSALGGAAEGLALGAVSAFLPRSRLGRGAVYAVASYAAAPWGGLPHVLRSLTSSRAPVISALARGSDQDDRTFLEHLAFGVTFSLLYRSRPARSGTEAEE